MTMPRDRPPDRPGASSARDLARVLDTGFTIPGTGIRFGLDAILGLIPGGGDLAGAALSSVIVLMALRQGVPAAVLWRMVGNVAIDTAIGTVPVLGDIFDFVWKSNSRNAELLERYAQAPDAVTKRSRWVGILVVAVILLVLIGIGTVGFLITRALWRLLTA
jgi:hypothetical protein